MDIHVIMHFKVCTIFRMFIKSSNIINNCTVEVFDYIMIANKAYFHLRISRILCLLSKVFIILCLECL